MPNPSPCSRATRLERLPKSRALPAPDPGRPERLPPASSALLILSAETPQQPSSIHPPTVTVRSLLPQAFSLAARLLSVMCGGHHTFGSYLEDRYHVSSPIRVHSD